jgi:hypothetical protein
MVNGERRLNEIPCGIPEEVRIQNPESRREKKKVSL